MKNVLLLVHDDPGQEARFQAALDLTRALGGHLSCLDVTAMPIVSGDLYTVSVESELIADERARESANRKALELRLAREDVSWDWIDVTGTFAIQVKEAAKTADIIVLNRRLDSAPFPEMRSLTSDVVISTGKAVVAVPEDSKGFQVSGRAVIAWNGSKEAMKAVQTAIPLLQLAGAVTIIEIDDGPMEIPAEDAAAYLSRHGISARINRQPVDVLPVTDAILAEAKSSGAGYIVMGGFGHNPLMEAVFGGVSRDMLTDSPIPTVMTH
ncbi:MAG TPA: universal stress protein [Allosphingosinicella sp.]|nr:universal stress protein [Allosphingosinicella sp.]